MLKPTIHSSIGELTIVKAGNDDEDSVLEIMRDAARWLEDKGIPQWTGMLSEGGRRIVQKRIMDEVAYIASLDGEKIGTVTILWEDGSVWEDRGLDGLAGYVHGLAIPRRYEGKEIGKAIMKWAMDTIKERKALVRLDCMGTNQRLCRFYEDLGFSRVGEKTFANGWKANLYEKD